MPARDAVSRVVAAIDRETDTDCDDWGFVLMGPIENATVIEWLMENSKRRIEAVRLWSLLFTVIRWDTGEIVVERAELADMLDITPRDVSRIMGELASINAISKKKEGRKVRYFLNPKAGTRLSGRARMMPRRMRARSRSSTFSRAGRMPRDQEVLRGHGHT